MMCCRLKVFEGFREKKRARDQSGLCTKAGLRLEMLSLHMVRTGKDIPRKRI